MDAEPNNSSGQITSGIESKTSVLKIINFISMQLPFWRDDPNRIDDPSEKILNTQLSKFLNYRAKEYLPMFLFAHEEPQQGNRSVDISVSPETNTVIGARTYTIYDPILVIECKRLPAPSADREKEYVTGSSPNKITGGIQRFKLGLHGAKHDLAAMIGYIQKGTSEHWLTQVNSWILELVNNPIGDGCAWANDEILNLLENKSKVGIIKCNSRHRRSSNNRNIELYHLWISMKTKSR